MKRCLLVFATFVFIPAVFSATPDQQIKLLVQDTSTGLSAQTFIYFSQGLSTTYDSMYDVEATFDTSVSNPVIYSFTSNGVPCYTIGYGNFTQTTLIRLGIRIAGGSTCKFYPAQLDNFEPTSMVLLEDRYLGTVTDLRTNSYSVYIDSSGSTDNRFYLLISYPPQISITEANCDNTNGIIAITEDDSITWTGCSLYNSQSGLVMRFNNIQGNFQFQPLSEDTYTIEFEYGLYTVTQAVSLPGNHISIAISASTDAAMVNENISFYSNAVNAFYCQWDMGDSTIITGIENPIYAYSAPGTYNVQLICSNPYGCNATASLPMQITDAATSINTADENSAIYVFSYRMDIRVQMLSAIPDEYTFELYNMAGQLLDNGLVTSNDYTIHVSTIPTGIYIIRLTDKTTQAILSKKLLLTQ